MSGSRAKAGLFRSLHVAGSPLVLYNIWDPGSAGSVAGSGARAIATSSWAVAHANGYEDGENMPLAEVMQNLRRITHSLPLPVSIDLEGGYGETPAAVAATITDSISAGAIGCNIEDSFPGIGSLRDVDQQVERIRHARVAADKLNDLYFINARTDVFFQDTSAGADAAMAEVVERAAAYSAAGADGLFIPGLSDEKLIRQLVSASPLPINIMVDEKTPSLATLARAGVARVSYGAGPYIQWMKSLAAAAKSATAHPVANTAR